MKEDITVKYYIRFTRNYIKEFIGKKLIESYVYVNPEDFTGKCREIRDKYGNYKIYSEVKVTINHEVMEQEVIKASLINTIFYGQRDHIVYTPTIKTETMTIFVDADDIEPVFRYKEITNTFDCGGK